MSFERIRVGLVEELSAERDAGKAQRKDLGGIVRVTGTQACHCQAVGHLGQVPDTLELFRRSHLPIDRIHAGGRRRGM